jgi:DNA-directed RNA polymerase specialized sigma24 family protein
MNKDWVLSQESFDALLAWLDSDREQAGNKYEEIRERLIKIFVGRGCYEPEDLADETINRVIKRLNEIEPQFVGDRARYFYGVANKVHLEYLRRKPLQLPSPAFVDSDNLEEEYRCLEHCLGRLTPENHRMVLQYYQEDRHAKIDHRKLLAQKLGIAPNALRIRAYRIRASLLECVKDCLARSIG